MYAQPSIMTTSTNTTSHSYRCFLTLFAIDSTRALYVLVRDNQVQWMLESSLADYVTAREDGVPYKVLTKGGLILFEDRCIAAKDVHGVTMCSVHAPHTPTLDCSRSRFHREPERHALIKCG
ncbi:hypothetical protein RJ55_04904 [Drechmeria coniospora]|nr:hypothetical protein RJ55_04904 [Drechmeria coniospora]